MKTQRRHLAVRGSRFTSFAVPAGVLCIWLSSAFSAEIAHQELKAGSAVAGIAPNRAIVLRRQDRPTFDYRGIGGSVFATG